MNPVIFINIHGYWLQGKHWGNKNNIYTYSWEQSDVDSINNDIDNNSIKGILQKIIS
jgi:hypothetical protein